MGVKYDKVGLIKGEKMTWRIEIAGDRVRIGERFVVSFQRTLRIPDDGGTYPLPPSLGRFPLRRVIDYAERLPASWREWGGVFLPMYQREAMWLAFEAAHWKPNAVKIGVGGVNALSGDPWDERLRDDPQDYLVAPNQPWLDGVIAGEGIIRQFVAMPLGQGYTLEAQLSGAETTGGLQILVYDPRPGIFPDLPPPEPEFFDESVLGAFSFEAPVPEPEMGLAAGGRMLQKIYPDPHGLQVWDQSQAGSLFVHILNSQAYQRITGEAPPPSPVSAQTYTQYGLPWFELYDEAEGTLALAEKLAGVQSVGEIDAQLGLLGDEADTSVEIPGQQVKKIERRKAREESGSVSKPDQ
jgi:hypothetical protein